MIEIIASNPKTTAIYRFRGKQIFIKKTSDSAEAAQMVSKLESMGAIITFSSTGWIRVDLTDTEIKGLEDAPPSAIEKHMVSFFQNFLKSGGFSVTTSEI